MHRSFHRLAEEIFDLVIVGGGVLGGFLAHESARRGLKTALIERSDFASGTTSASGKVLHGGLRYLQHLAFGLAAESNREQSRIAALAPQIVRPLAFVVPARSGRRKESAMLRTGAWAWRVVQPFLPGDDRLPSSKFLDRSDVESLFGRPVSRGLAGAMQFHDWQIRSPERLTVALVCDARSHGAAVANYVEARDIESVKDRGLTVLAADRMSDRQFRIRGRTIVNATGPWGTALASSLDGSLSDTGFAKGVHVVIDHPEPPAALALPLRGETSGSTLGSERRVFIMPWEGRTLVGATYSPYNGAPGDVEPQPGEVHGLLDDLDREWPQLGLRHAKPLYAYAGLYPIFGGRSSGKTTFEASLQPRIVDHEAHDGPSGLVSAISVKLTGAWRLAEEVLEVVEAKLQRSFGTSEPPSARRLIRATPTPLASGHLHARTLAGEPDRQDLEKMIEAAVAEEMAASMADFVFRRTWLGHLGRPDRDTLDLIAREMGRRLDWNESELAAQKERTLEEYRAVSQVEPRLPTDTTESHGGA